MLKRCQFCGGELRLPTDLLATPLSRVCAVCGRLTEIPDDPWQVEKLIPQPLDSQEVDGP